MRRHHRRRLLALLGALVCVVVAGVIAINFQSQVDAAANKSPGTDSAGMIGVSMVVAGGLAATGALTLVVVAASVRPKRRWLPPPDWPPAPPGWEPPDGWKPDPSWPPAPADWEWWDEQG